MFVFAKTLLSNCNFVKTVRRPALFIIHCSLYIIQFAIHLSCSDNTDEAAQFFLKGNVQLKKREYTEAIRFYTEAIAKKSDFADAYNNRGLAHFRNGNREIALADYTRALETDPDFAPAYLNRAEVRLETGDAPGSLQDLQRIEKTYRDSTFYQTRLADTFGQLNRPADAQAAYDRALQLAPANAEALTNRGSLFFNQKQYPAAEADFRKALTINPKQPESLNNLSLILARQGKPAQALPLIDRAIDAQPAQPFYRNNKAYLLLLLNRNAEALPLIEQSLRQNEQNAWAHRNLGLYHLGQNQPAPALTALKRAEQLDASVDELYLLLGRAYFQTGNRAAACEAWGRGATAGDERAKTERALQCR